MRKQFVLDLFKIQAQVCSVFSNPSSAWEEYKWSITDLLWLLCLSSCVCL